MGRVTQKGELIHWSDCAGMRISFYGIINVDYYVTSHSTLVAYLCNLKIDDYISDLITNKYFKLFGNVLPGDLSSYKELKRTVPNHAYSSLGIVYRFYPIDAIKECSTEEDYQAVLKTCSMVLKQTMLLYSKKWANKKVAISVTGGKDSGVTLASASQNYDFFSYFSYISKPEEKIDADAASFICSKLGLSHRVITIPDDNNEIDDFDMINKIIYVNGGSVGFIKPNEVRKRSVLIGNTEIDIEIKSWVNEIVRAYWYKKYNKTHFPILPTGKYLASMYKIFVSNRILFQKTSRVFEKYIEEYLTSSYNLANSLVFS